MHICLKQLAKHNLFPHSHQPPLAALRAAQDAGHQQRPLQTVEPARAACTQQPVGCDVMAGMVCQRDQTAQTIHYIFMVFI